VNEPALLALDLYLSASPSDEQKRSGFCNQYSNYQIEYSRNLVFEVGRQMDQMFQALIDRSRIDLNKPRIRQVVEALSPSPNGFTASKVAPWVRALSKQSPSPNGPATPFTIWTNSAANRSFRNGHTAATNRCQPV
jgi:hypothetical protein